MLYRLLLALALTAAVALSANPARAAADAPAGGNVEKDPHKHDEHDDHNETLMGVDKLRIAWTIGIFLALLAILYPTAWKQILVGLKKREEHIRRDIADAEAARLKAEATLKEYNAQLATAEAKVRELITAASAQGEKVAADIRMRAQQEAEEAKNRATKEIESAKKQALSEIYERAAELSTSIAEKILKRSINADDQRDLVRQSLEQLQNIK